MEMPAASPAAAAPPWIMLRRVVCEQQDPSVEMAGYLSLAPATPPRASILNLREGALRWLADDDSNNRVTAIAADTAGLLLHAFAYPFMGIEEGSPVTLVVASDFGRADAGHEGLTPSTILRIPNRGRPASAQLSNLSSIQNFGLVSRPGSGGAEYVVAELRTPYSGEDNAWVISFTSGAEAWVPRELKCPSSTSPLLWLWDTHDVVTHNGTLWWVDLTIGLLGCDLFADEPALHHVEPPAFPVGRMEVASLDNFELAQRRLVRVSRGMLRFVAVSCLCDKPTEEPLVLIWRLVQGPSGEPIWEHQCSTSLTTIWASDRYKDTGMPQEHKRL
ncbi:hypothetical protein QOZ80_3AG0235070 [Eleusine coracana subsp. coracana]|nr:hypothetical protein QOZ80_3AG0235070 [Eleusine coracana subsp. coracana]